MSDARRLVWDLPLRLFHWIFATCIVASYVTAKLGFDWMQWHFYLGYTTIGLLVFRILWGFFGPRHARFSSFLHKPSAIWLYVRGMFSRNSTPSIGHNPVGGLMVFLMIVLVAIQAGSSIKDPGGGTERAFEAAIRETLRTQAASKGLPTRGSR